MIGWNYWHCIPTKLIDAERFTHELMKHVVKLTNENELNCVNLCYRFASYNWKIPKFFLLNSFFFIKKGTTLGNAGRFWTFFFLVSRRFKGLFFVCLLEVYQLTKKGLWSAWKPTQSAGFFPTQSAILVKVSGGYHHIQLVGGGFPVRNLWRMRKVRTGEDLWRQSDQSTLWGLTDFDRFFGSGEIIFSGTQMKQITDPKYLHIHHGVLLKKGVFWMIFCECSKWARKCIGAIWYKFCGVVFLVVLVESQQGENLRIELDWNMMHDGVQIDIQCRSGSILHIV